MNLQQIFGDMGAIGWFVVITLMLMSIYSFGVMFDKFRKFRSARNESIEFLPKFTKSLKDGRFEDALEVSRSHRRSHVAKVVASGILEYMNDATENLGTAERVEAVQRAVDRASALTSAEMKSGLGGLATIGATSPFIGLFGTVVGIIHAFEGIAATGSGGVGVVSGGIAEALVAIPAVMAFNYFTGALERFESEMQDISEELVDLLRRARPVHARG
jgi:biopolymer transport protein ExbB/biopolymer transport protein TolQ